MAPEVFELNGAPGKDTLCIEEIQASLLECPEALQRIEADHRGATLWQQAIWGSERSLGITIDSGGHDPPVPPPVPSPTYQRLRRFIAERMRMLTGNGITEVQQGRYRLIGGEELSDTERDELLQLCPRGWTLSAARSGVR